MAHLKEHAPLPGHQHTCRASTSARPLRRANSAGHTVAGRVPEEAALQVHLALVAREAYRWRSVRWQDSRSRRTRLSAAASETPGGCPPAWPRHWGPRPALGWPASGSWSPRRCPKKSQTLCSATPFGALDCCVCTVG